jgi:hypothetical protein
MQGKCLLPWFQSQSRRVFFALHDLDAALARRPESAGLDAFTICAVKFRGPAMCCDHKEVPNGVSKCTAAMIKEVPCIKPALSGGRDGYPDDAKERTATHVRFATQSRIRCPLSLIT